MKSGIGLLLLVCISYSTTVAQTKGVIRGFVKDKNTQEPIVGALIAMGGTAIATASDLEGNYKLEVPVGTYSLKATYLGYKAITHYNITSTSGNAQTVNFELEATNAQLNEVTVTFDKGKSAIAADMVTPMSTQKLTSEEIRANPGGNFDVSKVIQVLPGVSGGTSVNRNDIIVRGGAPNENVYYLDGIEIPVLNHFQTQGASGGATGILNVSFIDDVQLSSSAFDARYDNALAATFAIKQRNGNPEKFSGNVRLSGTEFATTLEGPLGTRTSYLASARRSYLQFLFQLLDLPIRPEFWDFQYKVAHKLNDKTTLNVIGIGAIDKFRLATPKDASPENEYIARSNPLIDQWTYTVGLSLKRLIHKGYINLALSRNEFNNGADKFQDNRYDETYRTLKLRSRETESKGRLDVNQFVNGWKIGYGLMGQHVHYRTDLFNKISEGLMDSSGKTILPPLTIRFNSEPAFFKWGAFAQLSKRFFNEHLLLSAGLRTDGNTFLVSGKDFTKTLSPRLSLSYALLPKFDITASVGRYYKIPIYTNLGYKDSSGTFLNKSMNYIESRHYTIGWQYLPQEDLRITMEGFFKNYSDYPVSLLTGISTANQGSEFTAVGNEPVQSTGKGQTYGLEMFIQQKLVKSMFYALSSTIYSSKFSGLDGKLVSSSWNYGYLLSTSIGLKLNKGWELGLKYRISGGQVYTPFQPDFSQANYQINGTGTLDFTKINSERLAAFQKLDVRIDKKMNFKKLTLDLFIDIQNVLGMTIPGLPRYTFKRKSDNSDFETSDGKALKPNGSNGIPVLLESNDRIVVPTIGFIVEF